MSLAITGMRTVGVPVTDQDRAVEFYVNTLGFEKRLDAPLGGLGGRWIEVAPAGSSMTVALVPAREDVPAGVETGIHFTTSDAAAVHKEMAARGISVDELLLWEDAPPMFVFRDPDGNRLEIVEAPGA
jgi:lactoylglutathione lyase